MSTAPDTGAAFDLDHSELAAEPRFAALAQTLRAQTRIDSPLSFNRYCRTACAQWAAQLGQESGSPPANFTALLERIERGGDGVIPTLWGGVVVTQYEAPRVEKYLVVRRGRYLALEKHADKDEHIEVREGAGLILVRRAAGQSFPTLTVQALTPGDRFYFEPGREHCLIGTENLLVFEHSTDPKGMDKDLVFLYEPEGSAEPPR